MADQGTYAPDTDNRWMGSANIDVSGDIAVGYSVSSSTTFPSIRVAGRLAGDPAGQLSQGEETLTDVLLLDLARAQLPGLSVEKVDKPREARDKGRSVS